jgi:hypothetical protein
MRRYNPATNSMERRPSWEANRTLIQVITNLLLNMQIHYCLHKKPPRAPILSHINPTHTLRPSILDVHFSIILPTLLRSSEWFLLASLSKQISVRISNFSLSVIFAYIISTSGARVCDRVSPCGICGGKSNTGTVLSPSSSVLPVHIIPPRLSILVYHLRDEQ